MMYVPIARRKAAKACWSPSQHPDAKDDPAMSIRKSHFRKSKSRRARFKNLLSFEILEPRQLLATPEIAYWDFGDTDGTTFQNASIIGSQASDIEWRTDRTAFQTNSGNLDLIDDGSNQFFTDLRQKSNTSNLNPLDLSSQDHLRLQVNFASWDLTNADQGAVHRFDLKRSGSTEYAHLRLRKTASGSEVFVGFNGVSTAIPMNTTSGAVSMTLDLDLDLNIAEYDIGGVTGTLNPSNGALTLTNETLNFGVFNKFLGSNSSSDTIVIDSMGLSVVPQVTRSVQSGNWTDPATWDNGLPDEFSQVIVTQGNTVTLDGINNVTDTLIVHGTLDVEEDGSNRALTSRWVHVNSGGVFQIGAANDRFDDGEFKLTLTGTDVTSDHVIETGMGTMVIENNDGFLMAGMNGRFQFFGEERLSFTKLGATAEIGATTITVENVIERNFDGTTSAGSDGELDWQVGDEIVIASSSRDYSDEEVRFVTGVNDTGTQTVLTLDSPLVNRHYGEIEVYDNGTRTWDLDLRAEVAVLNRSINIEGTQDTDGSFGDRANFGDGAGQNLGIGGHTMIMSGAGQITVDGVRFNKMGQTGNIGRYPIHWHLAGDRTGDLLRNSSITNSNNRGTTIHGTHNLVVQGNVYHDIHGHGIFMEDGVEVGTQYLHNIVLGVHTVGGDNSALDDPFIVDTHDVIFQDATKEVSSAAYWMTHPSNVWTGNISAGSEGTGFWFIFPTKAIGASANDPANDGVNASIASIDTFIHNTSHASPLGMVIDRGADIEIDVGDPIFQGNGELAGRYYPSSPLFLEHFTAYKHGGAAIYTNVDDGYTFDEFKYADNFISSFQLRSKTNSNTLYVGHSRGNADTSEVVAGHSLYNNNVILKDNHYAGFTGPNGYFFNAEFASKRQHFLISGSTFEDDGTADQIRYDNPNGDNLFLSQIPIAGIDVDGTLTGHVGGGPGFTVIPDHPFHKDADDFVPSGWEAIVSEDYYASFELISIFGLAGAIDNVRITNPTDVSISKFGGQGKLNVAIKLGWGDYVVDFPDGLGNFESEGFRYVLRMSQGDEYVPSDQKANVFQFKGIAGKLAPAGVNRVGDINALRNATETVYYDDANGDLWMKLFYEIDLDLFGDQMEMLPVEPILLSSATVNPGSNNRSGLGLLEASFDQIVWEEPTLQAYNHSTAELVDVSAATVSGLGTNDLQWDMSSLTLPDGRYTVEILTSNPNAPHQTLAVEFHIRRGDVNGDAAVNFADYSIVGGNFDPLPGEAFRPGDANGDGRVNFADYGVIGAGFNPIPLDELTYDWGDAGGDGTSFPTTEADNGARHVLGTGLRLGAAVDEDSDGQPSSAADNDSGDDGITFVTVNPGNLATIDVLAAVPGIGFLNAWIDFNNDGDWLDEGEQIFEDQAITDGNQQLQFSVPSDAFIGDVLSRFRLTSSAGYSFSGLAASGEVEDYSVSITSNNDTASFTGFGDFSNFDNFGNGGGNNFSSGTFTDGNDNNNQFPSLLQQPPTRSEELSLAGTDSEPLSVEASLGKERPTPNVARLNSQDRFFEIAANFDADMDSSSPGV